MILPLSERFGLGQRSRRGIGGDQNVSGPSSSKACHSHLSSAVRGLGFSHKSLPCVTPPALLSSLPKVTEQCQGDGDSQGRERASCCVVGWVPGPRDPHCLFLMLPASTSSPQNFRMRCCGHNLQVGVLGRDQFFNTGFRIAWTSTPVRHEVKLRPHSSPFSL